jgi:regulator of protease activity HflC (stomatin/prohibitin superfamily)
LKNILPNGFIFFIFLIIVINGLFTVKQQTVAIVERLGKFESIKGPGLHLKIPVLDRIAGRLSLKIQQLDVIVETKTEDNVFVKLKVSVQFMIIQNSTFDAFYKLQSPHDQITSYVFDTVRAEVPKMILDHVFLKKDDIAIAIKRELEEAMLSYGYGIVKALVTDIDPDIAVKNAMNRINAAEREKKAAEFEGEAERIRIVAKARAEAESKRLQGQGIADQRREIARGLEESVGMLHEVGINSQEASSLLVITQHYDTLHSLAEHTNSNLILLPNSPNAAADMLTNMVTSFTAAQMSGEKLVHTPKKHPTKE